MHRIISYINQFISNCFTMRVTIVVSLLWLLMQVLYIYLWKYEVLVSDPGNYVYYAQECVKHGTIYPDTSFLFNDYIFNSGWINFILLWLHIFGNVKHLPYVFVIFNAAILYLTYRISFSLFKSEKTSCLCTYIIILLPSFFTITLHTYSELLYVLLSLLSTAFVISKRRHTAYIAGILIALSIWTRPIATAWIIGAIVYYLCRDVDWRSCIKYIASYAATCTLIAVVTHINFPDYVYKANTGGVNLVMGANDYARGGYCHEALQKGGLGYIDDDAERVDKPVYLFYPPLSSGNIYCRRRTNGYTYRQADSIRTARAINWIKQHPKRYAELTIIKFFRLYEEAPSFVYTYNKEIKYARQFDRIKRYYEKSGKYLGRFVFTVVFFGFFIWGWRKKELLLLNIPIILCTGATILTASEYRYNMVMLPLISIAFSVYISNCYPYIRRMLKRKHING